MTAEIVQLNSIEGLYRTTLHHLYVARDAEGKMGRARARCGVAMHALRQAVEADGQDWWTYWQANIRAHLRSRRDAEKLLAIGRDKDPEGAAAREQDEARERMANVRRDHNAQTEGDTTDQGRLYERACKLVRAMSDDTWQRLVAYREESIS